MPRGLSAAAIALACLTLGLAGCQQFARATGKTFFVNLKAALLDVDLDLNEKGVITEKTVTRLRKVYADHQAEYGKSKTYEMFDFYLKTIDYAMHPTPEKPGSYELVRANKKLLLDTMEAEFPGH
jgi:hypothetical protein